MNTKRHRKTKEEKTLERYNRIKKRAEEKAVNEGIKQYNKNVEANRKTRRELGKKIEFGPMEDLIPIKRAVNKGIEGFELRKDFGFFDIVRVVSFDYNTMDDNDLNMHIHNWDRYYRTTSVPIKRLSLNMPIDTSQKIARLKERLEHEDNPLYREGIEKEIKELQIKFEGRQSWDYFLIYYAKDLDSLMDERVHITASLEEKGYVITLKPLQKLRVLNQLSNPYSYKKMLEENFTVD